MDIMDGERPARGLGGALIVEGTVCADMNV